MKKKIEAFILMMVLGCLLCGCSIEETNGTKISDLTYTIVEENVNDLYLIFCKNNPRLLRKLFVKVAVPVLLLWYSYLWSLSYAVAIIN